MIQIICDNNEISTEDNILDVIEVLKNINTELFSKKEINERVYFHTDTLPNDGADPMVVAIIEHINKLRTGDKKKGFTPKVYQKTILLRIREVNAPLSEVLVMIDRKFREWGGNPDMEQYLVPDTLFRKRNFASYYDQRRMPVKISAYSVKKLKDEYFRHPCNPSGRRYAGAKNVSAEDKAEFCKMRDSLRAQGYLFSY